MTNKIILTNAALTAMLALAIAPSTAVAEPITLKYAGIQTANAQTGKTSTAGNSTIYAGMLGFNYALQDGSFLTASGPFHGDLLNTFCIEPGVFVSGNGYISYDTQALTTLPSSQPQMISWLYDTHYNTSSQNANMAAAFQLSLWEIVSGDSELDVLKGSFSITSGFNGSKNVANTWLKDLAAWLATPESQEYESTTYQFTVLTNDQYQNQLAVSVQPARLSEHQVPEPGTLALLGIGALATIARRTSRRAT